MTVFPTDINLEKKPRRRRRRNRKGRTVTIERIDDNSDTNSCTSSSTSSSSQHGCRKVRQNRDNDLIVPELSYQEQSMYVAMDCEMVGIGEYGRVSSLARVTIVDWNYNIILDQFIRQNEPVTDYRTYVSGIKPDDLTNENAIDILTCRQIVLDILKDKCLIGHALKNDLNVLGIQHPWQLIRDTAKYEPFMKIRFINDGILWPRKLKDLCYEKLNITIQEQTHSAYEDAMSALKLYQLVRTKWEKVMNYKISKTAQIVSNMTN